MNRPVNKYDQLATRFFFATICVRLSVFCVGSCVAANPLPFDAGLVFDKNQTPKPPLGGLVKEQKAEHIAFIPNTPKNRSGIATDK